MMCSPRLVTQGQSPQSGTALFVGLKPRASTGKAKQLPKARRFI